MELHVGLKVKIHYETKNSDKKFETLVIKCCNVHLSESITMPEVCAVWSTCLTCAMLVYIITSSTC